MVVCSYSFDSETIHPSITVAASTRAPSDHATNFDSVLMSLSIYGRLIAICTFDVHYGVCMCVCVFAVFGDGLGVCQCK